MCCCLIEIKTAFLFDAIDQNKYFIHSGSFRRTYVTTTAPPSCSTISRLHWVQLFQEYCQIKKEVEVFSVVASSSLTHLLSDLFYLFSFGQETFLKRHRLPGRLVLQGLFFTPEVSDFILCLDIRFLQPGKNKTKKQNPRPRRSENPANTCPISSTFTKAE